MLNSKNVNLTSTIKLNLDISLMMYLLMLGLVRVIHLSENLRRLNTLS